MARVAAAVAVLEAFRTGAGVSAVVGAVVGAGDSGIGTDANVGGVERDIYTRIHR